MAVGIPAQYIDNAWYVVAPLIEMVLDKFPRYGWGIDDVRISLEERDMQLWADSLEETKLIALTKVVNQPQARECWVWLCGGEMNKDFMLHLSDIEHWAQHIGCDSIVLQGRKGWAKRLKGWGDEQVLIRKTLEKKNDSKIH